MRIAVGAHDLQPARLAAEHVEGRAQRLDDEVALVARQPVGALPRDVDVETGVGDADHDVVVQPQRQTDGVEPGPRLALVAGTRTRTGPRGSGHRPQATTAEAERGRRGVGVGRHGARLGRTGDGPVGVLEAVAGDGADDPLAARDVPGPRACSSPATLAADAGSTKTASLRASSR